ncbi:methylation-associated defense system restriction endonuclease subunit S MAD5 [Flagellimonas meridianipacifica]|uniref:Type I restriction enzyme S subunit n=1 Tax=Flagellimonas meridianipacifica TaxID=1080225 RepID=A0A2T0MFB5_9FLAO|nr:restriction endonuclease subunit S [Allomuricauda pacifica]PRX56265.1 type I restriction enzyme S subunit [Allomuricauda pacifica]
MKTGLIKISRFDEGLTVLKPDYYLNKGKKTITDLIEKGVKYDSLSNLCDKIYQGGIFKRVFVESETNSFKYVTATDMMKVQPLDTAKKISKKYTPWIEEMTLRESQFLVSCAGTVGNTALVNKSFSGSVGSQEIIRIESEKVKNGFLYAYISSPIIKDYIQSMIYGAVVPRISPVELGHLPILLPSQKLQEQIHNLIIESSDLLSNANLLLKKTQKELISQVGLKALDIEDYDCFGNHSSNRKVSAFHKNISEISSLTINAFNHSSRLERVKKRIKKVVHKPLGECLNETGLFSTGSFKRLEIDSSKSIKLINQSDIFNFRKKGKMLSKRYINTEKLVEYGEVLIAGVGTLGENEAFCRPVFANEELKGQLVAGEFIRMKTNDNVPSGYLYSWLSSDYGFRLIRATQSGTKLCRPIPSLLKDIPVPILEKPVMNEIDTSVKKAHTMLYQALSKEEEAIALVEKEIEKWQK